MISHVHGFDGYLTTRTVDVHVMNLRKKLRLRQVVGNLVSNAVRHSPDGGRVALAGRATGPVVELSVADEGEGIAAADLPHVFERFWRADPSRTRASGGSGLGLAIVRQLVEAHVGTVTATSTPGTGSVLVVRLPVDVRDEGEQLGGDL